MKRALSDEIVYAVLRRHEIIKPSLAERVELALDSIRPMLASHGGDVELVKVAPPQIEVRFVGACDGCPASALTFHAGVKKAVEEACPEITDDPSGEGRRRRQRNGVNFVSPFALQRGRQLARRRHARGDSRRRRAIASARRREGAPVAAGQDRDLLPERLRPSRLSDP